MKQKYTIGATVAAGVLAIGVGAAVFAKSEATIPAADHERFVAIALTEVPGTVQEVEPEKYNGKRIVEVEILTEEGKEMEVKIAADTGEVLNVNEEGSHERKCGKEGEKRQDHKTSGNDQNAT